MDSLNRLDYSAGQPDSGPRQQQRPMSSPPSYWASMRNRVPPYSVRPVLIVTTIVSFIYLLLFGIASARDISDTGETTKLKLFDALVAAFCLAAACIEAFGFASAIMQKLHLARLYSKASMVAFVSALVAEIIGIVEHFAAKSDIIDSCTTKYTGAVTCYSSWFGGSNCDNAQPMSATDARSYCESQWSRDTAWVFVWFFVVLILGAIFVSLAFSFVKQLQNPSSVQGWGRRRNQNNAAYSSAFNYDDESLPFDAAAGRHGPAAGRYSYEEDARYGFGGGSGAQHMYPPPPGPPPPLGRGNTDEPVPSYEAPPRKSMASIDLDRKDPNLANGFNSGGFAASAPYASDPTRRPGSSRSAYRGGGDDDEEDEDNDGRPRETGGSNRRLSDDTLRGADEDPGTHTKI